MKHFFSRSLEDSKKATTLSEEGNTIKGSARKSLSGRMIEKEYKIFTDLISELLLHTL